MFLSRTSSLPGALVLLGACFLGSSTAGAQEAVPNQLSVDDAIAIAKRNSPTFRAIANDQVLADWDVKSAYGSLLPSASASTGLSWQGAGEQQFGSLTGSQLGFADQPSFYFSNYNVGLTYSLSGTTLLAPGQAKASRDATGARILNQEALLIFRIKQQYLDILRQAEEVRLAGQESERAEFNLRLAQGRLEVGTNTPLDVRQAEVAVGRARVTSLQSANSHSTSRLRLLQSMGVDLLSEPQLSSTFVLEAPVWTVDALYGLALDSNPALGSLQANERAAEYGVRVARSSYLPSLFIQAGVSAFTRQASSPASLVAQAEAGAVGQTQQCEALNELFRRLADPLPTQDCGVFGFTDAQRQVIENGNDVFPFDFTRNPAQASLTISIPIFQGLGRQRDVAAARLQREDLQFQIRETELALRADITAGLAEVRTAYETAVLEEQNQQVADEQLRLAQEQYRVGSVGFIQLVEGETVKAQADRARVAAIFAYHDAVASLESVVGTTLRNP